jgi:hypothetical protein
MLSPNAGLGPQMAAIRQQAQSAIARGAPRAQVIARLQQMGVDATGL